MNATAASAGGGAAAAAALRSAQASPLLKWKSAGIGACDAALREGRALMRELERAIAKLDATIAARRDALRRAAAGAPAACATRPMRCCVFSLSTWSTAQLTALRNL